MMQIREATVVIIRHNTPAFIGLRVKNAIIEVTERHAVIRHPVTRQPEVLLPHQYVELSDGI